MKVRELFAIEQDDIQIIDTDLDNNGRLRKKYPNKISGTFFCNDINITSLEGSPQHVGGDFSCANTNITSLEGIGKKYLLLINGTISLRNCKQLKSNFLGLLLVKGLKSIIFNVNEEVEKIINKHLISGRDILECQEELISNGLKTYAKL